MPYLDYTNSLRLLRYEHDPEHFERLATSPDDISRFIKQQGTANG